MLRRRAGILVHPTSLLARNRDLRTGFLEAARPFLDWAEAAGLSLWQMLPLGPPDEHGSPYSSLSLFAGDPSWLPRKDRRSAREETSFEASEGEPDGGTGQPGDAWLDPWALFAALRERHGPGWWTWPAGLAHREPRALAQARRELRAKVDHHRRLQLGFDESWRALRSSAQQRSIGLFGDLPLYPALDSADVWAHPELFDLDSEGRPRRVAGVPPDYFSETGQLWGNPVYRWVEHRATAFAWWRSRFRTQLRRFDRLRLDHFRGLEAFWAVPRDSETAEDGTWVSAPGVELLAALQAELARQEPGKALGEVLAAEDLGVITEEVTALRRQAGLPGVKILQFAFDEEGTEHLPTHHQLDNVVYTGTHDNDTTAGWLASLGTEARARLRGAGADPDHPWSLVEMAYRSPAATVIVPLQDLLGLGSEARMNTPGTTGGNWSWKLDPSLLTPERALRLRRLAEKTGRRTT